MMHRIRVYTGLLNLEDTKQLDLKLEIEVPLVNSRLPACTPYV